MNNCDETMLWMQNSKGEEYEAKIITRQEFRSLTKALEIAVDALEDTIDSGYDQAGHCNNSLKQISEILEQK